MKTGDALQETAVKGWEAINTLAEARDTLLAQSDRMQTDIALLRQKVAQLESRLETAASERDHYMRFSTDLVSKLNVVQMTIEDAVRSAKHAAFQPALVPVPKAPAPVNTNGIESLIKRLPVNGGQHDAGN